MVNVELMNAILQIVIIDFLYSLFTKLKWVRSSFCLVSRMWGKECSSIAIIFIGFEFFLQN